MFDKIQSRRVASNTAVSGGNPPKISAAAEVALTSSRQKLINGHFASLRHAGIDTCSGELSSY